MKDICEFSNGKAITVVAGTHIISRDMSTCLVGYPEVKNIVGCAICPVVSDGIISHYSLKKHKAPEEYYFLQLPNELYPNKFDMDGYTMQIKICVEAVLGGEVIEPKNKKVVVIPSLSSKTDPFNALGILAKYNKIPIIYVNGAQFGGSLISGPFPTNAPHWFISNFTTKPIPKNVEYFVTATINVNNIVHGVGVLEMEPAIEVVDILPILYKDNDVQSKVITSITEYLSDYENSKLDKIAYINEPIFAEILNKLKADETNGILNVNVAKQNLRFIKINMAPYEQFNTCQIANAIPKFASYMQNGGMQDSSFMHSFQMLITFQNECKNQDNNEIDFSKDSNLFWGRDREKSAIMKFIDSDDSVLFIHGLRGIGKTKLVNRTY